MKKKLTKKEWDDLELAMSYETRQGDMLRARSITVGTCFGGTTELMMRGNNGSILWSPMQPVEVIELIHQLAANVGCHIQVQPRKDFSSWREWNLTEDEKTHLNGHPPFVNDMSPFQTLGITGVDQEVLNFMKVNGFQGVGGGAGGAPGGNGEDGGENINKTEPKKLQQELFDKD